MLDADTEELTNMIYDTLMQNTQYPQLDLADVDYQEVNASIGRILFEYRGASYQLILKPLNETST
jgi:hypothetical protein